MEDARIRNDPNFDLLERWHRRVEKLDSVLEWIACTTTAEQPPEIDDFFGPVMCEPGSCEACDLRRDYYSKVNALMELLAKQAELPMSQDRLPQPTNIPDIPGEATGEMAEVIKKLRDLVIEAIAEKDEAIAEKDEAIAEKEEAIAEKAENNARSAVKDLSSLFLQICEHQNCLRLALNGLCPTGNHTSSVGLSLLSSPEKTSSRGRQPSRGAAKIPSITNSSLPRYKSTGDASDHVQTQVGKGKKNDVGANFTDEEAYIKAFVTYEKKLMLPSEIMNNNDNELLLFAFQNDLQNCIKKADMTVLKGTETDGMDEGKLIDNDFNEASGAKDCSNTRTKAAKTEKNNRLADELWCVGCEIPLLTFPSLKATENAVSHKILSAIMSKVSTFREQEVQFTREQNTEVTGTASSRKVDFVISHVTQYVKELRLSTDVVPVESKALHQADKSFSVLKRQAVKQILGHLAAALFDALCFAGVGIDCVVRGAVLTLISTEVFELALVRAGTKKAALIFRRSGDYPLFDEEATNLLLNQTFSYSDFFETRTPHEGFKVLAALMSPANRTSPLDVVKCFYKQNLEDKAMPISLIRFLGSGTFCNTYELSSVNSFLKVPKHPSSIKILEAERDILWLMDDEHIPKAREGLGILEIQVRCEASVLQCLKLEGAVGVAASKCTFTGNNQVREVACQVMKALRHAHSRRIAHLDVRPSNVIISYRKQSSTEGEIGMKANDDMLVQLVDWGCAATFEPGLYNFRGCLPYAHDDLLNLDKSKVWHAAPKHDYASLAYSIATIILRKNPINGSCAVPWQGFFRDHLVTSKSMADRNELTKETIEELLLQVNVENEDVDANDVNSRNDLLNALLDEGIFS